MKQKKCYLCWILVTVFLAGVFFSCLGKKSAAGHSNHNSARRLLLRDEGLSQLSYIDIARPELNWFVPVPPGRDLQLVGNSRVLVGTANGFEEHEITTGKKSHELTAFPGTVTARRLRNGNTLLAGINWQGKNGIVLVEVDKMGKVLEVISYPGYTYVRLIRETTSGTFLVTADETVFEGNRKGAITWKVTVTGLPKPHAWQALPLGNGHTLVSTGFAKNFQVFNKDGKLVDSIIGPAEVNPHFFAGFQVLASGNFLVTNWQGHGPKFGGSGVQLLEFTPKGALVWSWKQDASKFSSLQGVILLDGLDISMLHAEDASGKLVPVRGDN